MKRRVKKIFQTLDQSVDVIVIKNATHPFIDDNFFYVTGIEKGLFENSFAFLVPDGSIELVVPELETESAQKSTAHIHVFKTKKDLDQITNTFFSLNKTIGINFKGLLYSDFKSLKETYSTIEFVDVSSSFMKARLIKDDHEIEIIKQACAIADSVVEKIPDMIHDGMHEYEIAAEIVYHLQKNGADQPAFDPISSFGPNTAEPHYTHGSAQLKKGDFALFDFGARYRRYHSDITRTFVSGPPNHQQQEMHETVNQAQQIGLETIHPGIKGKEVHDVVASYIDSTKFKDRFIHSTGHQLGLAVHDGPGLTPDSEVTLQNGMILTVEPGIYLPGFGGVRIEDDILITNNGFKLLTHSNRELLTV